MKSDTYQNRIRAQYCHGCKGKYILPTEQTQESNLGESQSNQTVSDTQPRTYTRVKMAHIPINSRELAHEDKILKNLGRLQPFFKTKTGFKSV